MGNVEHRGHSKLSNHLSGPSVLLTGSSIHSVLVIGIRDK